MQNFPKNIMGVCSPDMITEERTEQVWCSVIGSTLKRLCESDVAVSTLYRRFYYNILNVKLLWGDVVRWSYYLKLRQHWHKVVKCSRSIKVVMNLKSRFQRCNKVAYTTFIVYWEFSFYYLILRQCCSDVAIFMLWQQRPCNVSYWLCDFTTLLQVVFGNVFVCLVIVSDISVFRESTFVIY